MDYRIFHNSLAEDQVPNAINIYLEALWYDAKGNWNKAHQIIQDIPTKEAARIHAYLHRKEGDNFNAGYWYRQAGKEMPAVSIAEEWNLLVTFFLVHP